MYLHQKFSVTVYSDAKRSAGSSKTMWSMRDVVWLVVGVVTLFVRRGWNDDNCDVTCRREEDVGRMSKHDVGWTSQLDVGPTVRDS